MLIAANLGIYNCRFVCSRLNINISILQIINEHLIYINII